MHSHLNPNVWPPQPHVWPPQSHGLGYPWWVQHDSPRTWWEMLLPGSSGIPWLNPFVFAMSGCHVATVVHHGGIGAVP